MMHKKVCMFVQSHDICKNLFLETYDTHERSTAQCELQAFQVLQYSNTIYMYCYIPCTSSSLLLMYCTEICRSTGNLTGQYLLSPNLRMSLLNLSPRIDLNILYASTILCNPRINPSLYKCRRDPITICYKNCKQTSVYRMQG